jgi:hypothetical protein
MNEYFSNMIPVKHLQITDGQFSGFFTNYYEPRVPVILITRWTIVPSWSDGK